MSPAATDLALERHLGLVERQSDAARFSAHRGPFRAPIQAPARATRAGSHFIRNEGVSRRAERRPGSPRRGPLGACRSVARARRRPPAAACSLCRAPCSRVRRSALRPHGAACAVMPSATATVTRSTEQEIALLKSRVDSLEKQRAEDAADFRLQLAAQREELREHAVRSRNRDGSTSFQAPDVRRSGRSSRWSPDGSATAMRPLSALAVAGQGLALARRRWPRGGRDMGEDAAPIPGRQDR